MFQTNANEKRGATPFTPRLHRKLNTVWAVAMGVMMMRGIIGAADDTDPKAILEKVNATYQAMATYQARGTVTMETLMEGMKMTIQTDFSIALKKPNLYRITWSQKMAPGIVQSGAVWSDGAQPRLFMGMGDKNTCSKATSDELALASATGISGGAAHTIPSLFLPVFKNLAVPLPSRLINPKLEKTEPIGGEDCYVISGSSAASKQETCWISKIKYVIRKCSRSLEAPEGGRVVPEMTDEEVVKTIKETGGEVTEENKQQMRQMMKTGIDAASKVKGSSVEVHEEIASPDLKKEDFQFTVPEGTVFKESMFPEGAGAQPPAK